VLFNKYIVRLMIEMYTKGYVTRKTQTVYSSILGYYIALRFLRKHGLIECDGVEKNMMKRWKLTPKGRELVEHILEIRKLLGVK